MAKESTTDAEDSAPAEGKQRRGKPPSSSRVSDEETAALRLKSLAEDKYSSGDLKFALKFAEKAFRLAPDLDGLLQMATALRVLRSPTGDHYRALLIEPFSHINTIRRQYKSLALVLHPDKNAASLSSFAGSEEAFKKVSEAFQILSDGARRRDYDTKLKMDLEILSASLRPSESFWTTCAVCRLFHQFDRKYLGQMLLCPRCRKSFLAVEVSADDSEEDKSVTRTRSGRLAGVVSRSLVGEGTSSEKKRNVLVNDFSEESVRKKPKEKTLAEMQDDIKMKSRAKKKNTKKSETLIPCKKRDRDSVAMAVVDSDFYDFDKHRTEKSFRKGQIWAIYDDDDGMPRHYGLIDQVFSTNSFHLTLNWLDIQIEGDEARHISSGEFKVGKPVQIDSLNMFSHQMQCERAAKEVYRIFPQKGSVWALYNEESSGEARGYDIVVLLSSFSEDYGLTMAYLEKVLGFKTIFKRREIGAHTIRWLEKCESRIFSHQIPARKIVDGEIRGIPSNCWELDPASLSAGLLQIGWNK